MHMYEKKLHSLKEQYESEKKQAIDPYDAQIKQLDEKYTLSIRLKNEKFNKEFQKQMNQALDLQRYQFENAINGCKAKSAEDAA